MNSGQCGEEDLLDSLGVQWARALHQYRVVPGRLVAPAVH